jgi:hypothetical protein
VTSGLSRLSDGCSIVPLDGHCTLLCNSIGNTRSVFDVSGQLSASCINVIAPGFTDSGYKPGI